MNDNNELTLPFPAIPQYAPKLAEVIVNFIDELYKSEAFHLDYNNDSIEILDQVIDHWRKLKAELNDVYKLLFSMGCYLGEIMVRNNGAEWIKTTDISAEEIFKSTPLLIKISNKGYLNPIGKVFKRFSNGDEDNLELFYNSSFQNEKKNI